MSVLCLIANPNAPALDAALVQEIQREVGGESQWLNPRIACDIIAPLAADPLAAARALVADRPIDIALLPRANRRKRLLIADMDSTMIEQECIDELADALGLKPEIAAITARAMNGELDFEDALRTRVKLLAGLTTEKMAEIRRERLTYMPGGRALVQTMKTHGAYTALVSGGFTFFAEHVAKRIGFDEARANVLEVENDRLTGAVLPPILGRAEKLARLKALAAEHDVPLTHTLAVGDGANDLDMIKAAGLGVALHAKPAVAAAAGVRIDYGDLTALLYLQGFTDDDFVR